jgi:hypothetical protein
MRGPTNKRDGKGVQDKGGEDMEIERGIKESQKEIIFPIILTHHSLVTTCSTALFILKGF